MIEGWGSRRTAPSTECGAPFRRIYVLWRANIHMLELGRTDSDRERGRTCMPSRVCNGLTTTFHSVSDRGRLASVARAAVCDLCVRARIARIVRVERVCLLWPP
eukprot:1982358-Prymnesium_polylepis.1